MTSCEGHLLGHHIVLLASLPGLRYLHLRTDRAVDIRQLYTSFAASITYLVLVLPTAQAVPLMQLMQARPLPQLSLCHVGHSHGSEDTSEWTEAKARLRERLGAVWCEKKDDILRWRADRV